MSLQRRFRTYLNLKTTASKLRRLLAALDTTTFQDFIEHELGPLFQQQATAAQMY
jgi:uncharacterized protein (DUF2164 family)